MTRLFLFLIPILFPLAVFAQSAAGMTYHGRLLKPNGQPVATNVQFKIQILSPGTEECVLWEETQSQDLTTTAGVFVLHLNSTQSTRTDGGTATFNEVFSNRKVITPPAGKCAGGSTSFDPTAQPSAPRLMRLSFNDGTFSGWEETTDQAINYAPKAIDALQVSGFPVRSLLRFAEADGTLVNTSPLSNDQYTELQALLAGTSTKYMTTSSGTSLPTSAPTALSAGKIWLDGTALKYYDGSTTQTLGTTAGNTQWASGTGDISYTGKVGIGVTGPTAKLEVQGQIVSRQADVAAGATVDFQNGNSQTLDNIGSSTITLQNLIAGGSYTLVVRDLTSRTYSFAGCAKSYFSPSISPTVSGSHTVFDIQAVRTGAQINCYVRWASGFVADKIAFATAGTTTYVVPAGITSILVRGWGGGGGGGGNDGTGFGATGGGGAYASQVISVTPGETLTIVVGGGGTNGTSTTTNAGGGAGAALAAGGGGKGGNAGGAGSSGAGGGGGGGTFLYRGSTILFAAGGGGGGGGAGNTGAAKNGGAGGAGGVSGANGGGAGGTVGATGTTVGAAGATSSADGGGAGGGGGGYIGGTGGAFGVTDSGGGGGGGGSSFATTVVNGSGAVPGESTDTDRGTAGNGGNGGSSGSAGKLLISTF